MRILYFGKYNPDYARNSIMIQALHSQDIEVVQCRVNAGRFWWAKLFLKYLRLRPKYDVMIVGFPGQEVMFLARILTKRPIVFDAFTSHYGGYILDRHVATPHSLRAKRYRFLDTYSCRLADVVLLDTNAHIQFFVDEFGLSKDKFKRIWVGVQSHIYKTGVPVINSRLKVIFFGNYIPLHGVKYIIEAAKMLDNVDFAIIGNGKQRQELQVNASNNVAFFDPMSPDKLNEYIQEADVCLGIFGKSLKTALVIPNKVYIAVAMNKPIITSDTPAIRELFDDQDLVLVPQGDSNALRRGIEKLRDPEYRTQLSRHAYQTYCKHATMELIGKELKNILQNAKH